MPIEAGYLVLLGAWMLLDAHLGGPAGAALGAGAALLAAVLIRKVIHL
ncbi:hypothetical protein [Planomonospora sphaerica]|nr:hypothetical protein [Planomonospora sphaerica]